MPLPLVYIVLISCYALLVYQYRLAAKWGGRSLVELLGAKRDLSLFNHRHFAGLLLMLFGIVCYYSWRGARTYWLQLQIEKEAVVVTVIIAVVAAVLSGYAGLADVRFKNVTINRHQAFLYLLLRIMYLAVYEVFFRAVLLSVVLNMATVYVAVGINVMLYALAHRYSPPRERWASIPLGILLCYLTIQHHSVWPAALVHILLSLPYEVILLTRKQVQPTYVS